MLQSSLYASAGARIKCEHSILRQHKVKFIDLEMVPLPLESAL